MPATGSFQLLSWQENTYDDRQGIRLTRAEVTQRFEGTVTGDGAVQWLMTYRPDGTARFVGLQRVDGSLEGKSGSFVMETSGDFDGQVASWEAVVIPGSGTDDLHGLSGRGTFTAPHGSAASFELEYSLE